MGNGDRAGRAISRFALIIEVMESPSLQYFFPTVLQVSKIDDASELNHRLVAAIHDVRSRWPCAKPETWSCNLYTTLAHPQSRELLSSAPFSDLEPIIVREATHFGQELGLQVDKYPPRVTDFWVNILDKGHAQDIHRHPNSIISGVYYVQVSEDAGDLILHAPADDELFPPIERVNPLNAATQQLKPVTGQMLLFRSWLRHSVMPNQSEEERISVAFDICL